MYTLFLVEDDRGIADGIVKLAGAWGYTVTVCEDFRAVTEEFVACAPHLVLLDIGLPPARITESWQNKPHFAKKYSCFHAFSHLFAKIDDKRVEDGVSTPHSIAKLSLSVSL